MFFLDFFCGGIVSCSSAKNTVGANVGGYPKNRMDPRTRERDRAVNTFRSSNKGEGDWESPASGTNFQSYESIYTCPRTPLL
jgi:hypothetical protein